MLALLVNWKRKKTKKVTTNQIAYWRVRVYTHFLILKSLIFRSRLLDSK